VAIAAALVLALGIGGGLLSSRWRGPRVEETPRAEARPPPAAPPAAPPSQVREKPPAPAAPPVVEEPPAPPPPVAHAAHVAVEQAPRPRDERTPVGRPAKPKRSKLRDIEHGATLNPF
jgi:hypothetical protein